MQAIRFIKYGNPDVLSLEQVEKPSPKAKEILVKLHTTSLNASDVEFLRGKPAYIRFWGLFKPRVQVLGSDIAGIVEAIGSEVTQFNIGDAVFGDIFEHFGGLAEYVCAPESAMIIKPEHMSFEQAAAMPQAALVALQSLQKGIGDPDKNLAGKHILINGGGGGAGSFAIQLAKLFGAKITAVDSSDKLDFMRKLGADLVIDYQQQDFATNGQSYDLIVDFIGTRSASQVKRALAPKGQYVLVGGDIPTLLSIVVKGHFLTSSNEQKIGLLMHQRNQKDLAYMCTLFADGEVVPIIDETYPLDQTAAAFTKLVSGKAKGKLVIKI